LTVLKWLIQSFPNQQLKEERESFYIYRCGFYCMIG